MNDNLEEEEFVPDYFSSLPRETSIETFREIQESGLLGRMQQQVYEYLFHHGPLTAGELTAKVKGFENSPSYHKRFSELIRRGVVKELGKRFCRITGRPSMVRDVTARVPSPIPAKISRPSKHFLEATQNLLRLWQAHPEEFDEGLIAVWRWLANCVDRE